MAGSSAMWFFVSLSSSCSWHTVYALAWPAVVGLHAVLRQCSDLTMHLCCALLGITCHAQCCRFCVLLCWGMLFMQSCAQQSQLMLIEVLLYPKVAQARVSLASGRTALSSACQDFTWLPASTRLALHPGVCVHVHVCVCVANRKMDVMHTAVWIILVRHLSCNWHVCILCAVPDKSCLHAGAVLQHSVCLELNALVAFSWHCAQTSCSAEGQHHGRSAPLLWQFFFCTGECVCSQQSSPVLALSVCMFVAYLAARWGLLQS